MQLSAKQHALLLFLVSAMGCDTAPPGKSVAIEAIDAWIYGDEARFAELHILGTKHNIYCKGDSFITVLRAAKADRSETECQNIAKAKATDIARLKDGARLLLQIKRAVCEDPDLTCQRYGAKLLHSQFQANAPPESYTIRKFMSDSANAVVYVDFRNTNGIQHRVVKITQINSRWYINQGILSE